MNTSNNIVIARPDESGRSLPDIGLAGNLVTGMPKDLRLFRRFPRLRRGSFLAMTVCGQSES